MRKLLYIIISLFFLFVFHQSATAYYFINESEGYKGIPNKYSDSGELEKSIQLLESFEHYSTDKLVYKVEEEEGEFIVVDGKEKKKYKNIYEFKFAPNGKDYYFVGHKHNGKYVFVRNNQEFKEYTEILDQNITPEGNYAFMAANYERGDALYSSDGNRIIVRDGVESEKYHRVRGVYSVPIGYAYGDLEYSYDGKDLAYVVEYEGNRFYWNLIINGVDQKVGESVWWFTYSPTQEGNFYFKQAQDKSYTFVENGKELNYKFSKITYRPDYSEDGKTVVFSGQNMKGEDILYLGGDIKVLPGLVDWAQSPANGEFSYFLHSWKNKSYTLFRDNKKIETFNHDGIGSFGVRYAPDGDFMYRIEKEGKHIIYKNGEVLAEHDGFIYTPVFLDDGENMFYEVSKDGKSTVVSNGKNLGEFDRVRGLLYTKNNNLLFLGTKGEEKNFYLNGDKIEHNYKKIEYFRYSEDTNTVFFEAQDKSDMWIIVSMKLDNISEKKIQEISEKIINKYKNRYKSLNTKKKITFRAKLDAMGKRFPNNSVQKELVKQLLDGFR